MKELFNLLRNQDEVAVFDAMEAQVRFAVREGGRTVGAGVVTKILA